MEKFILNRTFVCHAMLGLMLAARFVASREISVAEAIAYVGVAFTMTVYWCFVSYIYFLEKTAPKPPSSDTELMEKDIADLQRKVNGLILKMGMSLQ